ncbi:MAG: hypothetical protein ABEJ42_05875 [Halobacteriaceae archaeon]
MSLSCTLLGHDWGATERAREREEGENEVVETVREYRECTRCGAQDVVSENTEVRSVEPDPREGTVGDAGQDAAAGAASGPSGDTGWSTGSAFDPDQEPGVDETHEPPGGTGTEEDAVIIDGGDADDDRGPGEWPDDGEAAVDAPGGERDEPSVTSDAAPSSDASPSSDAASSRAGASERGDAEEHTDGSTAAGGADTNPGGADTADPEAPTTDAGDVTAEGGGLTGGRPTEHPEDEEVEILGGAGSDESPGGDAADGHPTDEADPTAAAGDDGGDRGAPERSATGGGADDADAPSDSPGGPGPAADPDGDATALAGDDDVVTEDGSVIIDADAEGELGGANETVDTGEITGTTSAPEPAEGAGGGLGSSAAGHAGRSDEESSVGGAGSDAVGATDSDAGESEAAGSGGDPTASGDAAFIEDEPAEERSVTDRPWPDEGDDEAEDVEPASQIGLGETVVGCESCGFREPQSETSHRAGDSCPECGRGYLREE